MHTECASPIIRISNPKDVNLFVHVHCGSISKRYMSHEFFLAYLHGLREYVCLHVDASMLLCFVTSAI